MAYYNLLISGAGSLINSNYELFDDTAVGTNLVWLNASGAYQVRYDSGWIIASADLVEGVPSAAPTTVYYRLVKNSDNLGTGVATPWSPDTHWIVDEGVIPVPVVTNYLNPNIIVTESAPVVTYDTETNDKITTVTITINNTLTGSVRVESHVTREKTVYVPQTTERYATPNLPLGGIYRFRFVREFEQLGYDPDIESEDYDVERGVYKVDKLMTYLDLVTSGIDLFKNLYEPLGLSKKMYESDEPTFVNTSFYRLVDPKDSTIVLYMPFSFIENTPDMSIDAYSQKLLTIDIGVHQDADMLSDMLVILKDLFMIRWGIDLSPTDAISLVTCDTVYITADDYAAISDYRKLLKSTATTQLFDLVFNSEQNKLLLENNKLREQVNALESIIQNG